MAHMERPARQCAQRNRSRSSCRSGKDYTCMRRKPYTAISAVIVSATLCMALIGCTPAPVPRGTLVVILESSPNNLDPRQGTDAQSEHVGALIFDGLVKRDEHFNLAPWLATSWEQPD